ncbi:helix-turn-helix domain-containing protein [Bacillus taeanensis]|uniref:HTH cro/C1-type domain-containing protein n=1 Tax=Bacillus taeanensis TaxID=273032 RepID=A0A366XRB3_9BACI|nr:helix-turn-helix domain-containing protein [Bacillus taeanensis]RBW68246.1 hypothetical protein DS031_17890 [Bacillus taeanensis]
MNKFNKELGEKIHKYRKAINMSTTVLSELSGTSQSTISKIENGYSTTNIETLIKICNALGITIKDLLPPDAFKNQLEVADDPEISQLMSLVRSLTSEEIRLLISILSKINKLSSQDREALKSLLYSLMNN